MAGEHMANRLSLVVASRHGSPWAFPKIIVGWKSVIAVGYWKQLISSVPSIKPDHPYTVLPNRSLSEGQLPKLKALRAREYNCRARRERRDRVLPRLEEVALRSAEYRFGRHPGTRR